MDFGTAINQAKQMRQTFRAFQHIEEVLAFAAQKQGELGEHERRIEKLRKTISDLEAKQAKVEESVQAKIEALQKSQAEAEAKMEEAVKRHRVEMGRFEVETEAAEKKLASVIKRLEGIKSKLED